MKIIGLLILLLASMANANKDNVGNIGQIIDKKIINYYEQTKAIEQQKRLIDAKLQLLETLEQCKNLGFDCSYNINLDSVDLRPLPKEQLPPPSPVSYPEPTLISITNKIATIVDYQQKQHTVAIGDEILNYHITDIGHNSIILKNKITNKKTKQFVYWDIDLDLSTNASKK